MTESPEQTQGPYSPAINGGVNPNPTESNTDSGSSGPIPPDYEPVYGEEPGGVLIERDNYIYELNTLPPELNPT